MKVLSIIKYAFFITGAIALLVALYLYQNTQRFLASAVLVEGEVIDLIRVAPDRRSSPGGVTIRAESYTYAPAVRFMTTQNEPVEFISPVSTNPPRYEIGDKLSVAYLQSDPHSAKINTSFSLWFAPLLVGGLGLPIFSTGLIMIVLDIFKGRRKELLTRRGEKIKTQFVNVQVNPSLVVNGRKPYRIYSQWENPRTATVHDFRSDNIWTDPSGKIPEEITVYIERDNPKRYYVDLSFLPVT